MTDLCVNIYTIHTYIICIQSVGYFRKEHFKDEKREIRENQWIMNNVLLFFVYVIHNNVTVVWLRVL